MRQVAASLNMTVHDAEIFYRLGLRARSHVLMSLQNLITAMAVKYGTAYRIEQEVRCGGGGGDDDDDDDDGDDDDDDEDGGGGGWAASALIMMMMMDVLHPYVT
jgi:hypothetical protein